ncbi:hypothetical protein [Lacinutrix salivirga]
MEYLKIISKTFEQHNISKISELKYEKFTKSKNYPSSEGVRFETNNFAGEIFYYSNGEMEYLEIEFLIFKTEKFEFKIVEKTKKTELNKIISEFLTERLTELKNVA